MIRQSPSLAVPPGFTLVEVLIGLALMAMLMTLIANGVRLGTSAWSRAEVVTGDMDDIETVQGLLRRTIVQAQPAFASADPQDMTIRFAGEPDAMTVVAPQPATQGLGPWMEQRFAIDRSAAGAGGLVLSWRPIGVAGQPVAPRQDLLLDRVAGLKFSYFGSPGPDQPPQWQDRWVDRQALPNLIRVSIERTGIGRRTWPDLVVATRVTTNPACLYEASTSVCRRER
jgi:general secretion pathway protein J